MSKFKIFVIVISGIILTACMTTQSINGREEQMALSGHSYTTLKFQRPASVYGAAITAPVYVNSVFVGRVGTGGNLVYRVKPGNVVISTSKGVGSIVFKKATNTLKVNAQQGKTYVIEIKPVFQLGILAPITDSAFNIKLID